MRFTLSSTALSSKLSALSRVINSKNSMPILSDFVFEANGNMLRLTASDSENTMTTTVELNECDGDGRFAIGSHDLLEAVKGFSEQPITFEVDTDGSYDLPLAVERGSLFESMAGGGGISLSQMMEYQLQALAEYRILNGYGSQSAYGGMGTHGILTAEDVSEALSQ